MELAGDSSQSTARLAYENTSCHKSDWLKGIVKLYCIVGELSREKTFTSFVVYKLRAMHPQKVFAINFWNAIYTHLYVWSSIP